LVGPLTWLMKLVIDVQIAARSAHAYASYPAGAGISSGRRNLLQGNIGPLPLASTTGGACAGWPGAHRTAFEWDILPVPSVKGKPGASYTAGHPVCCVGRDEAPEESWALMHWLMDDEFQGVLAEKQFLVPAKKKFQERFLPSPGGVQVPAPAGLCGCLQAPRGIIFAHYNAAQSVGDFNTAALKMIKGEVPLQGGLATCRAC